MTQRVLEEKKMRVYFEKLLEFTFNSTDTRIHEGKTVTPAFLFSVLLWYPIRIIARSFERQHVSAAIAFEEAIKESAFAIILVHNHPSGDPKPSKDDIEITKKLIEIGKILYIPILDHVIAGKGYWSWKENN